LLEKLNFNDQLIIDKKLIFYSYSPKIYGRNKICLPLISNHLSVYPMLIDILFKQQNDLERSTICRMTLIFMKQEIQFISYKHQWLILIVFWKEFGALFKLIWCDAHHLPRKKAQRLFHVSNDELPPRACDRSSQTLCFLSWMVWSRLHETPQRSCVGSEHQ
jgi:hypothetical protein